MNDKTKTGIPGQSSLKLTPVPNCNVCGAPKCHPTQAVCHTCAVQDAMRGQTRGTKMAHE